MKYRGKDDTIANRTTDKAADQTRAAKGESSRIRVGRVVSTSSHWKRLVEQGGFRAPRSTRRRRNSMGGEASLKYTSALIKN